MQNRADLLIENNGLKNEVDRLNDIIKSNVIGYVGDIRTVMFDLNKTKERLVDSMDLSKFFGGQLQNVQNSRMELSESYALLRQENERLKIKLDIKKLN